MTKHTLMLLAAIIASFAIALGAFSCSRGMYGLAALNAVLVFVNGVLIALNA